MIFLNDLFLAVYSDPHLMIPAEQIGQDHINMLAKDNLTGKMRFEINETNPQEIGKQGPPSKFGRFKVSIRLSACGV